MLGFGYTLPSCGHNANIIKFDYLRRYDFDYLFIIFLVLFPCFKI